MLNTIYISINLEWFSYLWPNPLLAHHTKTHTCTHTNTYLHVKLCGRHLWYIGSALDCWPTGQAIELRQGHVSWQNSSHSPSLSPAQLGLTVQNRGLKHQLFHISFVKRVHTHTLVHPSTEIRILQNKRGINDLINTIGKLIVFLLKQSPLREQNSSKQCLVNNVRIRTAVAVTMDPLAFAHWVHCDVYGGQGNSVCSSNDY